MRAIGMTKTSIKRALRSRNFSIFSDEVPRRRPNRASVVQFVIIAVSLGYRSADQIDLRLSGYLGQALACITVWNILGIFVEEFRAVRRIETLGQSHNLGFVVFDCAPNAIGCMSDVLQFILADSHLNQRNTNGWKGEGRVSMVPNW